MMSREMTNKEAIANLNHIYGIVSPDIQRSLDVAFKALKDVERLEEENHDNFPDRCGEFISDKVLEERPQGEWVSKHLWDNTHIWVCSECGNRNTHGITVEKACWRCGADMRGEEE